MTKLINEYDRLLDYLEKQIKPVGTSNIKKKEEKSSKKEKVIESTKRMLEEAKIEEFIDLPSFEIRKDKKGFDIQRFEILMRSKLIEEYKTRLTYERPYISVTELCTCLRTCYYERKRYQLDMKKQYRFSYLYLIQKVSTVIHDIFEDLYDFTEVEKTIVSEKYKVKGRVDALKPNILFEIKTVDAEKFANKYISEHFYQANIYAYILKTEYDYNIDTITIIYVLRDLKHIKVFDLQVDGKLAEKYLERSIILLNTIEQNKVVDPIGATDETCKYCMYRNYCEKDGFVKVSPPYLKPKREEVKPLEKAEQPAATFLL
jgi:CRISPR/Cas system-associated exonuclease Cas4 (RecB family)